MTENNITYKEIINFLCMKSKPKKSNLSKIIDLLISKRDKNLYRYINKKIEIELKKRTEQMIENIVEEKIETMKENYTYYPSVGEMLRRNDFECNGDSCDECDHIDDCPLY